MPSERPVLLAVEIAAFRGFRDPVRIPLNASAVIVSGPNGTGKTSFFDALQWLLVGQLPRLELHARRSDTDVVVNRWSAGGPASVALELDLQGVITRIVRTGTSKSNLLEWHGEEGVLRGPVAEKRLAEALLGDDAATLHDVLLHSALLQQEAVRSLLEAEPKQRFRFLASLMGVEGLSSFTDAAKRRSDAVGRQAGEQRREYEDARAARDQLKTKDEALRARVGSDDELAGSRDALLEILSSTDALQISEATLVETHAATMAQRELEQLDALAGELIREDEQIRLEEESVGGMVGDDLAEAQRRVARLATQLEDAQAAASKVQEDLEVARSHRSQLIELASTARPLLSDHCPVCSQPIDAEQVSKHLDQVVSAQAGLQELESRAHEAARVASGLFAELETARSVEREQQKRAGQIDALRARRARWVRRCADIVQWSQIDVAEQNEPTAEMLVRVQEAAARMVVPMRRLARNLGASSAARELEQAAAELRAAEQRLTELQALATRQSQRGEAAKSLVAAAARAAATVADRRLGRVQPLVDAIFARLDPHPAFTRLELRLGDYYRKGVAETVTRDEAEDVEADPLLVFSSSQANVAALTWFLALSWSAGPAALPFLLLDDPLQSLDDVNVLGFADLCRRLRVRRQLVISTHEPRLARLLERKLSARTGDATALHIRFTGWDRSGPTITTDEVADQHEDGKVRLVES